MTTDTLLTFAGLPIEGTPARYTTAQKPQRSQEELEILLTEVWDNPGMDMIEYITWEQYTPYFNDGDACIFHPTDVYLVPFDAQPDEDEDYIDDYGIYKWHISDYMLERYPENQKYVVLSEALDKIGEISSGSFDTILNNVFGDPARIRVYRDRIVLDEYFETPY